MQTFLLREKPRPPLPPALRYPAVEGGEGGGVIYLAYLLTAGRDSDILATVPLGI